MSEQDGWTPTSTWEDHEAAVAEEEDRAVQRVLCAAGQELAHRKLAEAVDAMKEAEDLLFEALMHAQKVRNRVDFRARELEQICKKVSALR